MTNQSSHFMTMSKMCLVLNIFFFRRMSFVLVQNDHFTEGQKHKVSSMHGVTLLSMKGLNMKLKSVCIVFLHLQCFTHFFLVVFLQDHAFLYISWWCCIKSYMKYIKQYKNWTILYLEIWTSITEASFKTVLCVSYFVSI